MCTHLWTRIGLSFLCAGGLFMWATKWGTPNKTTLDDLYIGCPADALCVDNDDSLWWAGPLGTVSVATDLDAGEVTPLDTFVLDSSGHLYTGDWVCLFVPRTDHPGVYALTRQGRLLSMSVVDSRISAMELADFDAGLMDACVADDSSRTIVASAWDRMVLIDLPERTISPLPVPVSAGIVDLEHAGGTRLIVAFLDGTTCLCDSQDVASAVKTVKTPEYGKMLTASPSRTLIALNVVSQAGVHVAVAVRDSVTLEHGESWQLAGDLCVTGITWLNDQQLAISRCENCARPSDHGEVVILKMGSTKRRRVKLDFEPFRVLALAPNRLAIADRHGGVRVIQLDP